MPTDLVMTYIISFLLGISLLYWTTLSPIYKHTLQKTRLKRKEALKQVKIRAIRHYYPGLRDLSPRELVTMYDIDRAYNNIAKLN